MKSENNYYATQNALERGREKRQAKWHIQAIKSCLHDYFLACNIAILYEDLTTWCQRKDPEINNQTQFKNRKGVPVSPKSWDSNHNDLKSQIYSMENTVLLMYRHNTHRQTERERCAVLIFKKLFPKTAQSMPALWQLYLGSKHNNPKMCISVLAAHFTPSKLIFFWRTLNNSLTMHNCNPTVSWNILISITLLHLSVLCIDSNVTWLHSG